GGEPPQSRGPTLYGGPGLNADNARTHLPPGGARGVVAAASYEARKYGIHSAMPVARARRLCPRAIFLPGSYRLYAEFSERIFALLETYSPLVEPMSLDEAFVDLTGCGKLHGPVLQTAERIRNEIKTTLGINASIGIASNKLLAKIASACAKPSGMLWIPLGGEQRFLAPLAVDRIPGVGPKSGEQFKRMGIRTVGSLAALPRDLLEEVHGKWGAALFLKSRGICNSPVRGRGEGTNRSVSRETTLETDSLDARFLESTLSYLVEKAAAQLRESGLHAQSVTLKLRYSDFKTVTRTRMLREPTSGDHFIFQAVAPLLGKLLIRRTRVRLVGVSLSSLTATPYSQTDLFQNVGREQWDRLYRGIDRIRKKHGFRSILRGKSAENL
ncbi:MAG: DNA polymerase IV, partial [Nitrospinaceae bacterium]